VIEADMPKKEDRMRVTEQKRIITAVGGLIDEDGQQDRSYQKAKKRMIRRSTHWKTQLNEIIS